MEEPSVDTSMEYPGGLCQFVLQVWGQRWSVLFEFHLHCHKDRAASQKSNQWGFGNLCHAQKTSFFDEWVLHTVVMHGMLPWPWHGWKRWVHVMDVPDNNFKQCGSVKTFGTVIELETGMREQGWDMWDRNQRPNLNTGCPHCLGHQRGHKLQLSVDDHHISFRAVLIGGYYCKAMKSWCYL